MQYKLLCIDMDGTLLNDNNIIPKQNIEALKLVIKKGVEVAITTGRLYASAKSYTETLGIDCYIIASNGTYIKHKDGNKVLYEAPLSLEQLTLVQNIVKSFGFKFYCNSANEVFLEEDITSNNKNKSNNELKKATGISYIKSSSTIDTVNKLNIKIFRATAIEDLNMDKLLEAKKILKAYKDLEVVNSMPNNFDVMQGGTSKGNGVQKLADILQIPSSQILCIGDRENDLSMINYAGLGVAMGNATEKLKIHADYITDTNNNFGVSKAIRKFIL